MESRYHSVIQNRVIAGFHFQPPFEVLIFIIAVR